MYQLEGETAKMKWSRGSQQFLVYLFHHFYSFLQHFPLRQAPVVYAAREGFGAACKVLVQYQAVPYGPIKKKWHPIPVIQHLWACFELETGRCQWGWWNFSWDCTARGSSARNLVAPSGSEALESNSGSISVGDRVETVLSGCQLSTTLCFTQFQYMWLTYTATIAFILLTSCYSRMLQQLFALSFSWLSLPHVRHNKIKVVQTLLASWQRDFWCILVPMKQAMRQSVFFCRTYKQIHRCKMQLAGMLRSSRFLAFCGLWDFLLRVKTFLRFLDKYVCIYRWYCTSPVVYRWDKTSTTLLVDKPVYTMEWQGIFNTAQNMLLLH